MSVAVRYDVVGPVASLTLDSPHNRNALSGRLVAGLINGLRAAEGDRGVRVVVIRGEGPSFCSGADLAEATSEGMEHASRRIVALQRAIVASPKAVVARVHGPVRAGGVGIVAACDVVVTAEEATYALTEVRLGLAAAAISLTVRARMSSRAASWATLGGEVFNGSQAAAWGLATTACPRAQLDDELERVTSALAAGHPQGLEESKRLLNRDLLAALDKRGEELAATSARLFASDAAREAMLAFLRRS